MAKPDSQRTTGRVEEDGPSQGGTCPHNVGRDACYFAGAPKSRPAENVPFWANLETDMMSYYEHRNAYMLGQMILCRRLDIQNDDADHDTLMVNIVSNMKWLGDSK